MTKGVITMNKKIRPLLITALVSALFLLALVAAAFLASTVIGLRRTPALPKGP